MARSSGQSHDTITRMLNGSTNSIASANQLLEGLAESAIDKKKALFVFDDTLLAKIFAKHIEGLDKGFDGSTGQPSLGIRFVTGMVCDDLHSMPMSARQHVNKALAGINYKTKVALAIELIEQFLPYIFPQIVLMDAHYFSKEMVEYLMNKKLKFLMKIPKNRTVVIKGKVAILKDVFKLYKNQKYATQAGIYDGHAVFFHAVKCDKTKRVLYYIGNQNITARQAKKQYAQRWKIETFYRTAKQSLGLGDCQSRSSEKQLQHVLSVMIAYSASEIYRIKSGFGIIENAIRMLRMLKIPLSILLSDRFNRNYPMVA